MSSKFKKLSSVALSFLFILSMVFVPQGMVRADNYYYTVRIFAGEHGTFTGNITDGILVNSSTASVEIAENQVTVKNLSYGDRITLRTTAVLMNDDSKYYAKGFSEAGLEGLITSSIKVTEDRDYVVSYGVRGDMVEYRVLYQDENGNELYAPDLYYGNVGDKPIVAFRNIDGYTPNAYNLEKTLESSIDRNVFTFIYTSRTTPAEPENPETPEAPEAPEAPGNVQPGNEQPNVNQEPLTEEIPEVINIDDEDTPLAPTSANNEDPQKSSETAMIQESKIPLAAFIGGGIAIAVICIGCIVAAILIMVRKKDKKKGNDSDVETKEKE